MAILLTGTTIGGNIALHAGNVSTYALTSITSANVTTALGYTPVTSARTITINGTALDLSANRTFTISTITGNAGTATTFSTGRTDYKGVTDGAVAGQLMWKNYGNNHTIFDASNSTNPQGGAVNNTNSAVAWSATYPTLMGWNGSQTYGVRVDSARIADIATTATTLQTARAINGTSFNGSSDITTANWGTARTITIGNTGKSVNGGGNVSWSLGELQAEYEHPSGVPRSNLGSPTVREMALFNEQFNNKTAFLDPSKVTVWKQQTNGAAWEDITANYTQDNIRRFIAGYDTSSNIFIPNGVYSFRIEVSAVSYVFLNALYVYWSSNSHTTKVHVWARRVSDATWLQVTSSSTNVSSWPGHLYLSFPSIAFLPNPNTSTGHRDIIRFEFIPTWQTSNPTYANTNIDLYKMQIWGGYPAGTRFPYTVNEYGDFTLRRNLSAPGTVYANGGSSTNWNTAFSWGNHASAGYITSSGSISGNAATATTLATARTLTIGATGKTFNGSANVSWTLAEIGAQSASTAITTSNIGSQSVSYATSAGNADTVDSLHASSFLRSDVYNSNYGGLQVSRNIGTIDGSWPDSDHTLSLENTDAGNIVLNFHRGGYTSNNLRYNGSQFRFDAALESTGVITASGGSSTNWNTAFSWGNHASIGYLTSSSLSGYATQTYVNTAVSNLVNSAPAALDTLNELAAALGNDSSFSTTITNSIATKAPLASPALTGTPTAPTAATSTNTTQIATTAFVKAQGYSTTTGTVTSVSGTGSYGGLTLSGTVTSSGNITLGGTPTGTWPISVSGNATTATTAGALSSMNISQFTNNTGYLTSFTETNTFLGDGGSGDTHPGTGRVIFTGQLGSGAPVLGMPATDNSNAFLNINRHPGEYNSQLGFSSNGNMYYRSFSATAINSSQAWRQVWDSGNLTNLNQLTNGPGFTSNTGTVTSVGGTGTVSGLSLSGTVTGAGNLTLGGTLSLTSGNVTTALGYTPYNATNPSGYISSITSGNVTTALGYTPYNATNPSGYITSSGSISGNAGTVTNGVYTNSSAAISGDNHITFGPNSTWGCYLRVGGNGRTVSGDTYASMVTTNGNLHLDGGNARGIYLNYYAGTSGVAFGNGASGVVAWMGSDGDLWKGSSDNSGTQYVYNSGTWSININGNAATATTAGALSSMNISQFTNNSGYIIEGGISFSGEYPMMVRTSANTAYSHVGIKFRGSDSALIVVGTVTASGGNSTNWNTAYSWGNHASAGYLTSITSGNVTTALGYTPYNATNPNGYITGISFANVSSKPTTISGYGITDAITTSNIGSQSVSNANTVGGYAAAQTYTATGNAAGSYLGGHYSSGGTETPNSATFGAGKLKLAMLSGGNLGFGGSWNDVLWLSGYTGGDVKSSHALVFDKYSTNVWVSDQNFDSATWGTGYLLLSTANYNSYSPTLTGTGASGTWGISVTGSAGSVAWTNVSSRPTALSQFTNDLGNYGGFLTSITAHSHAISDVSGLQTALDGKAASSHTHTISNITGLQTALDGKQASGSYLLTSGKAADSELIDGIDSSRILYGDGDKKSTNFSDMNASNQSSGFFFYNQPTGNPFTDWTNWINVMGNSWSSNYGFQIAHAFHNDGFAVRRVTNGSFASWRTIIDSGNIGSQSVSYASSAGSVAWTNVSSRPTALSQFSNDLGNYGGFLTSITAHTHVISDVTGLQTALDSKQAAGSYSLTSHTHADATTSVAGFMSAADKTKLNGIASGATANAGTVTSVSGTGTVSGLTLSGTVTSSGSLTLGGTLSLTSANVTTALGFTPYNATNPSGYITSSGSISGSAGSVTGLTLNSSANGINPDSVTQNQIGYNTSVSLFGQTDGGLYSSAYSSSWIHQIYGDFRTGQIAIRGKNSGTWQAWRTVLDSSNFSTWAAAASHTHTIANITGLQTALDGKQAAGSYAAASHTHTIANVTGLQTALDGKAASSHTHAISDVTGLQTALDGKALSSHTHTIANVTGLQTALDGKQASGSYLTTSGKAADSELIDGIDSSRIVYGDGSRGKSISRAGASANASDSTNASGFYFGNNVTGLPTTDYWNWVTVAANSWSGSDGYQFQLAGSFWTDDYRIRRMTSGTNHGWVSLIHSGNIGSQSVSYASTAGSATSATTAESATTATQLNKFGDISGQDWNTYYINGKMIVSSVYGGSGPNFPTGAYNYGAMLSYGVTGSDFFQVYFPENGALQGGAFRKLHYRTGWNGSWSAWKSVVDQEGQVCTIAGSNQTGIEIHSNVGYNQDPLTYFLIRGQADTSWKALKVRLTGDAGGQDIEFRRIAENGADARMWYIPRGGNTVNFEYPIVQPSDSRLKDNITPISTPVDKIKSLRGVEFDWNSGEQVGTHDVGLIAQEVEAVLPEAVTTQEDGYKNLAYVKVIPLLVEAMKEQQAMIEVLKAEIELLKNK